MLKYLLESLYHGREKSTANDKAAKTSQYSRRNGVYLTKLTVQVNLVLSTRHGRDKSDNRIDKLQGCQSM